MRCVPLVFLDTKYIKIDCYLSNPNMTCYYSNYIYCKFIKKMTLDKNSLKFLEKCINYIKDKDKNQNIYSSLLQVKNKEKRDVSGKDKGWVLHYLYCAIYSVCYFDSFENGIDWVGEVTRL